MFANRSALCSALIAVFTLSLSSSATAQTFQLDSVSVTPGATWKLNREIVFLFNDPLDFSTVNPNTLQLTNSLGIPVSGEYTLRKPKELVFQATCPTQVDLSDGGFAPGENYLLNVPAGMAVGVLFSLQGNPLDVGVNLGFEILDTTILPDLFDDGAVGPPTVLVQPGDVDGSFLEIGDGDRKYFQLVMPGLATLPGYAAPPNLHVSSKSRVTVHVRLNQAVANFPWNLTPNRVRLEYKEINGPWRALSTRLELIQNCAGGPATLALTANGVLPQGRLVRAFISKDLMDLVGEQATFSDTSLRFNVKAISDDTGQPVDAIDDWNEGFATGAGDGVSLEDSEAALEYPRATWGAGQLTATHNFEGTGGINGEFDFHVPSGTEVIINTVFDTIAGGPGGFPTGTMTVTNGVLDIRDLYVGVGSVLRFQGPNPVVIHASGNVQIDGIVRLKGSNAKSVFSINTPQQPEPGATGQCGGGAGGVGSFLTQAVTPRGGSGFGAFGVADAGGQGGEAGWSTDNSGPGEARRAAGGGGGRFGHDQRVLWRGHFCSEETVVGLNAESGFPGADSAMSSQGPHIPYGGHAGESPFVTGSLRDDFFGRARLNFQSPAAQLITGELPHLWAGTGGGAGGDATYVPPGGTYPPANLIFAHQDKGAGGGGGGGGIQIFALGDVIFGATGRVMATGGHGNGGENTAWTNRVGGGSGGGSGGHIIIHTGGKLDFSQVPVGSYAIDARGGQGGVGEQNVGGAFVGESVSNEDARHVGINFGVDNPWENLAVQCQRYWEDLFAPSPVTKVVRAAGGDGGPGVVQLHVGSLEGLDINHDIIYPGVGIQSELASVVRPVPVGYDPFAGVWRDHLLPDVGTVSQAQSKWISLGQPQAAPGTPLPDLVEFLFGGTDPATGLVQATNEIVDLLPPILAPANSLDSPGLPSLAGPVGIFFDPAPLPLAYRMSPSLVAGFVVERGGVLRSVETAHLRFDGTQDVLALVLDSPWPVPAPSGQVTLRPRSFRVASGLGGPVENNQLLGQMSVKFEFQAAAARANGDVDLNAVYPAANEWVTDPGALTNHGANADFRFVRFRVTLDLHGQATGALTPAALEVDFLKTMFRF